MARGYVRTCVWQYLVFATASAPQGAARWSQLIGQRYTTYGVGVTKGRGKGNIVLVWYLLNNLQILSVGDWLALAGTSTGMHNKTDNKTVKTQYLGKDQNKNQPHEQLRLLDQASDPRITYDTDSNAREKGA